MTDPLLAEIDKMIEAVDNGVHAGYHSFEVSDKLEEIKKLIIADRERMLKWTEYRKYDDPENIMVLEYKDVVAIVKGEPLEYWKEVQDGSIKGEELSKEEKKE